ncbi:MAG: HupE/UreJ family protein [Alphaproteobacteria bacterium]|nr:HupE/UreJ family protein [Alphaproteobacteria bacterium]
MKRPTTQRAMKIAAFASLTLWSVGASAGSALAHHPLSGMPMQTFGQGLLSGIGHPVLGFDHLFFVVAMGIAGAVLGNRYRAPLGYIAAMVLGVGLMASGIVLPLIEPIIVLSLLVAGGALAAGKGTLLQMAVPLFALFGLSHGAAFGESIAAQESAGMAVLIGYLLGLAAVQYAIALGAGALMLRVTGGAEDAVQPRLAGAMVAGVGVFLALEALEGAAFSALGVG